LINATVFIKGILKFIVSIKKIAKNIFENILIKGMKWDT
jgi:hypothetical protein